MPGFVNNATGKVSRRATRFEERKGGSGPVPHYHYRNLLTPYRQVGLMLQAAPTMLNCSSGGLKKSSTEAKQKLTFAPGEQGQLVLQGQPGPHDDGRGVGPVLAVRPTPGMRRSISSASAASTSPSALSSRVLKLGTSIQASRSALYVPSTEPSGRISW